MNARDLVISLAAGLSMLLGAAGLIGVNAIPIAATDPAGGKDVVLFSAAGEFKTIRFSLTGSGQTEPQYIARGTWRIRWSAGHYLFQELRCRASLLTPDPTMGPPDESPIFDTGPAASNHPTEGDTRTFLLLGGNHSLVNEGCPGLIVVMDPM